MSDLKPYQRPEPTQDDADKAARAAAKIMFHKGRKEALMVLGVILIENMRLAKEVNDHRAVRGFEPLPLNDEPQ